MVFAGMGDSPSLNRKIREDKIKKINESFNVSKSSVAEEPNNQGEKKENLLNMLSEKMKKDLEEEKKDVILKVYLESDKIRKGLLNWLNIVRKKSKDK